jgi:hypothetical protein
MNFFIGKITCTRFKLRGNELSQPFPHAHNLFAYGRLALLTYSHLIAIAHSRPFCTEAILCVIFHNIHIVL